MKRTVEEINQKIKSGKAVVLTAEEVARMAEETSVSEVAKKVDVVTTATFGPMCSSGVFLNFGHPNPPIRMEKITLNDVPAYGGIAAVDSYLGATETSLYNEKYGGAHVIEELIKGKKVKLHAQGKGTDCYPSKEVDAYIDKFSINEAYMFNPRNAYQNYSVAVNSTNKIKYTYMGTLLPKLGNLTYSTSGELSPLLNDPDMRTIGIGTRIFLCGAQGYVAWNGTQFNTSKPKNEFGVPVSNAATLAVIGDLKQMSQRFIKAAYFEKYGVSIFIGIGIPIPIIDEEIAKQVCVSNKYIHSTIFDYGYDDRPNYGTISYEELLSGEIILKNKKIRTASLSSLVKAREIAALLKEWIINNSFQLTSPVQRFPENTSVKSLIISEDKK
ncbi:MAG: homocysteine biosynthesis protein [Bacteroidales bacterium]|nr:homocysteine biosynthesis protein [Bacteroidales bacterium]